MKAEEYLNQIPMWTREKNSLEDVRKYLEYLGHPDRSIPVIHVAGTNGKGSVCAYLTKALVNAGYRVGTFISPHLVEIRERFLINGRMAEEEAFERSFQKVKAAADALTAAGLKHPTFFEFLFDMAAVLFAEQKVDFWVMETGMGGRLDTTNVVERPLVSVITSISLDHTQYLGDTIPKIAAEKAGIIKEGIPVVYDGNDVEAAEVIRRYAKQKNALGVPVTREDFRLTRGIGGKLRMILREEWEEFTLPFAAPYQADNGALAWKALRVLIGLGVIPREKIGLLHAGMEQAVWPGRMEEAYPGVFLDGAHNPGGIRAFLEAAQEIISQRNPDGKGRIFLLFAAVADKDYPDMIHILGSLKPDRTAVVHMQSERGLSLERLSGCFQEENGCRTERFETTGQALDSLLKEKKPEDMVFCVGSLYLIGEIKTEIEGRRQDADTLWKA
ncbi:MAG: folylpolyglutamate synthase/dihydrofolate synthase family protein [Lachnospiraceae bacterium]|nr:folylpolyglutamate synthase/dihydrofolate synthase family protein [Lachnospiraceae bacterium]